MPPAAGVAERGDRRLRRQARGELLKPGGEDGMAPAPACAKPPKVPPPGVGPGCLLTGRVISPLTICLRTSDCSLTLPVSMPRRSAAFALKVTRLTLLPEICSRVTAAFFAAAGDPPGAAAFAAAGASQSTANAPRTCIGQGMQRCGPPSRWPCVWRSCLSTSLFQTHLPCYSDGTMPSLPTKTNAATYFPSEPLCAPTKTRAPSVIRLLSPSDILWTGTSRGTSTSVSS